MELTQSQHKHIRILLFLIPFLMGIGIDLYVPSLPAIANYFDVSSYLAQATIGFYLLGYACGQVALGILADSLGRRKILIFCGGGFVVFSFLSILSPNITFLITCRFFQGFLIAGPAVTSRAIAIDCYSGDKLTEVITYMSISWGLGPVIGPVIGGYLQHCFNWQADFYVFGFYSLITFIYAYYTYTETKVDLIPLRVTNLASSIKMVITHPTFILYTLINAFIYAILIIFNALGPFLIQTTLGYSVVTFGHIALLLGFSYLLGNACNALFLRYYKIERIIIICLSICIILDIVMVVLGIFVTPNLRILLIPTVLIVCLCGMVFPNIASLTIGVLTHIGGTASALYGAFISCSVFILTQMATLLRTDTQTPMAIMYLLLLTVSLILFLIGYSSRR